MLNLLLIALVVLVPIEHPAQETVSPTRVDALLNALLCDRSASSVQGYFDDRAYPISFRAGCAGASPAPGDKERVLNLLFELTGGQKDLAPCDAELWRRQRIARLTTRAGLFSESGAVENEIVRRAIGATAYCTSVIVVRSVIDGEIIEAALVLVWAHVGGTWVVGHVEMVCV